MDSSILGSEKSTQTFSNKINFSKTIKIPKYDNNTCRDAHMKTEAWTHCRNYIILNSYISSLMTLMRSQFCNMDRVWDKQKGPSVKT